MSAYATTLFVFLAAISALVILYSQRDVTFPGYKGKGGPMLPVITAGLGIFAIWLIGRLTGMKNVLTGASDSLTFGMAYSDQLLNAGAWTLLLAVIAVAAVATINLFRYGRAVM